MPDHVPIIVVMPGLKFRIYQFNMGQQFHLMLDELPNICRSPNFLGRTFREKQTFIELTLLDHQMLVNVVQYLNV